MGWRSPCTRMYCPTVEGARPPPPPTPARALGAAALWWWVLHGSDPHNMMMSAPLVPYSGGSLKRFRYKHECGCWVGAAVCVFASSVINLGVVLGRVDVPLQPGRVYSRALTSVDVHSNLISFLFPTYDLPGS
jgi:hypothetical protein